MGTVGTEGRGRGGVLPVVRYRFGPTLRRRWGGYVALIVLLGLVGGVAMASIAGARRTQSSYPTFLASTNPSDLSVGTALLNPGLGYFKGYDGALIARLRALPRVTKVESYVSPYAVPVGPNGKPTAASVSANYQVLGSLDGEFFDQDRVTVVAGRMADPARPDEVMATSGAAAELGLRVGKATSWGIYTVAQSATGNSSTPLPESQRMALTLTGIVVPNNGVVQDDTDAASAQDVFLTPALTKHLTSCCSDFTFSYLQLRHHATDVGTVETEIEHVMPTKLPYDFFDPTLVVGKAVHAIKPESIALGVFGAIAALAALLIGAQLIARQLRSWVGEERVLRSLGAGPTSTLLDGLAGLAGAVVLGAMASCAVAVCLSPLFPLGPVRAVYSGRGLSFDWTVLGLGALAIVGVLGIAAAVLAVRAAPRAAGSVSGLHALARRSRAADTAAGWGMSAPAVTGIRLALEPGTDTTPVRTAILGTVLAMIVVVATVVFGSSLNSLVSHPPLYGWNWAYELAGGGGVGDVPQAQAAKLLDHDHQVAAWSPYSFANLQVDGHTVPVLGGEPGAAVAPPVLSGHALAAPDQIVLGQQTLDALHASVGDTVTVAYGATAPHRLLVVGTATMPAIGVSGVTGHLTMGTGAWVDSRLIPASVRNSFGNTPSGPNAIFVRFRSGADVVSARAGLSRIAARLSLPTNYGVSVVGVQRPAEIVNYRSMGATPAILGIGLAAGAVAALGLTLVASVRRRRREMAVLKTMGFTGRQLAASVAWQSTVAVGVGVLFGIPLGIVVGRWLWTLFAEQIYAVPGPEVPVLWVVAIGVAALVLANLIAAVPGRMAARTRTAVLLRAE
jgi:putative ABC transport system permease protein